VNSNKKEVTTNEIALSLDLISVKDGIKFYVSVSKNMIVSSNTTPLELQTLLFLLFSKSALPK